MSNHRSQQAPQAGFTIVELLIALAVLSVLLILSTVTLMQIGRLYSKGTNAATTQNTARTLINDVASQLQLSGSVPDTTHAAVPPGTYTGWVCIGSQRYTYRINHKLTGSTTDHVLWRDTLKSSICPTAPLNLSASTPSDSTTLPGTGVEMMPTNTRLTDFRITAVNNTYDIAVTVAYGDDDLVQYNPVADTTHCVGSTGTEYCGVSKLNITVVRRVQ